MNNFSIQVKESSIIVTMMSMQGINLVIKPEVVEVTQKKNKPVALTAGNCVLVGEIRICLSENSMTVMENRNSKLLAIVSFKDKEITLLSDDRETIISWQADKKRVSLILPITERKRKE